MTAPRMTAKEKADRGPIAAVYRPEPNPPANSGAWKTDPRCAIAGACLTGAHTTPDPAEASADA